MTANRTEQTFLLCSHTLSLAHSACEGMGGRGRGPRLYGRVSVYECGRVSVLSRTVALLARPPPCTSFFSIHIKSGPSRAQILTNIGTQAALIAGLVFSLLSEE